MCTSCVRRIAPIDELREVEDGIPVGVSRSACIVAVTVQPVTGTWPCNHYRGPRFLHELDLRVTPIEEISIQKEPRFRRDQMASHGRTNTIKNIH